MGQTSLRYKRRFFFLFRHSHVWAKVSLYFDVSKFSCLNITDFYVVRISQVSSQLLPRLFHIILFAFYRWEFYNTCFLSGSYLLLNQSFPSISMIECIMLRTKKIRNHLTDDNNYWCCCSKCNTMLDNIHTCKREA